MSDETEKKNYFAEVMHEIIVAAGDPSLTLQDVEGKLQVLYSTAEGQGDQQTMALVSQTYDGFLALSTQTGHALNFAANARELAERVVQQRDDLDAKVKQLQEENENLQDESDMEMEYQQDGLIDNWHGGLLEEISGVLDPEWNYRPGVDIDEPVRTFLEKLRGFDDFNETQLRLIREAYAIEIAWHKELEESLRGNNG